MNWSNLKRNKCPKCSKELTFGKYPGVLDCDRCEFKISESKMSQIVNSQIRDSLDHTPEENLEALNNL